MTNFRGYLFIVSFLFFGFFFAEIRAQHGLAFAGQEAVQDQRTGLDLTPRGALCLSQDFEISFELSFIPNQRDYFGYILRIITNEEQNIDLIYDRRAIVGKHFKVIYGDRFLNTTFDIDAETLFGGWTKLTFRFDSRRDALAFSYGNDTAVEQIDLNKRNCLRILFGINDHKDFKTIDVPAMKIRNVTVKDGDKLIRHWPLDEFNGNVAKDAVKGAQASVINPMWVKTNHLEWELLKTVKTSGRINVAFDEQRESVFLVGMDTLLSYGLGSGELKAYPYRSGTLHHVKGGQTLFEYKNRRLLSFCIDQEIISTFDFNTQTWSKDFIVPARGTHYYHLNKFYSSSDDKLYFIGGYGHFTYKNDVISYDFMSGNWIKSDPKGDFFSPRYLAALGVATGGAYVVGGYGSLSGQQMLNPKNLYDFSFFDSKTNSFTKRYELGVEEEDFAFANSLVIDEPNNTYYGLVFPNFKYHASLQLIVGALDSPSFYLAGNAIPYLFQDTKSFADLFYAKQSKRFIAVTLFHEENGQATASIYSLNSPPLQNALKAEGGNQGMFTITRMWGALFVLMTALSVYFWRRNRWRKSMEPVGIDETPEQAEMGAGIDIVAADRPQFSGGIPRSTIFLFGKMQLFDASGNDITKQFTPLIKELFLVLLLHSMRLDPGVSSEKLFELLWSDKTVSNARNNRSVSIARLKGILDKVGSFRISKDSGYWTIEMDYKEVFLDYFRYLSIVGDKSRLDKQRIIDLSNIVQRGSFLAQAEYEWLDSFKSEISNTIIDTYLHFAGSVDIADDPEFLVQVSNCIFGFDPVNEDAMVIKCKALSILGKHSLATQTFDLFCKEYKHIYGEDFGKDFRTVMF